MFPQVVKSNKISTYTSVSVRFHLQSIVQSPFRVPISGPFWSTLNTTNYDRRSFSRLGNVDVRTS